MPPHISSSVSWHSKKRPALNSPIPFTSARRSSSSRVGSGGGAPIATLSFGSALVVGAAPVRLGARRMAPVADAADDHAHLLEGHREHAAQDQPREAEPDREPDETDDERREHSASFPEYAPGAA